MVPEQFELYRNIQSTITLVLSACATIEEAMPKILKTLCEGLQWSLGEFWIVDRKTNILRFGEAWYSPSEEFSEYIAQRRQLTFLPGSGLPGRVWSGGKCIRIKDAVSDTNFQRAQIANTAKLTIAFGFPIMTVSDMRILWESVAANAGGLQGAFSSPNENEIFGVITLFRDKGEQPDEELIKMVNLISIQIGQFVKLKQAEETLRRKIHFERTVAKISTRFVNVEDFDNTISTSLEDVGRLCKATRVCFFQFCDDNRNISTRKIDKTYEWYDKGVSSNIQNLQDMYSAMYPWLMENLLKGNMLYITDVSGIIQGAAFEKDVLEKQGIKSLLILPAQVEEKLLGFISFENVLTIDSWHEDDIALLHIIVEIMGSAILRKQTEAFIAHMAYHDALTNLPNRILFQDRLQIGVVQSKRSGKMIAVVVLDLDAFKDVNDSMGHHVGDLLLKEIAERLIRCVRGSDTVARTGGDEFSIILPDLSHESNAAVIAQKILIAVNKPYRLEDHEIRTSASIGISVYPLDSYDADELIKMADRAMYFSKQNGGNIYRFHSVNLNKHV